MEFGQLFSKFYNVCKKSSWRLLLISFVSADDGNQLKVRSNDDDALTQHSNNVARLIVHARLLQC